MKFSDTLIGAVKYWVERKFNNIESDLANHTHTDILPTVTSEDVGKLLCVSSDGIWAAEAIPNAEEESF